jgi:archaeal chaperonin
LSMEKDRVSKSKEIVDKLVSTGANTILIASSEVDQVIEDLLVARKVFAVRISTEEIDYVSRYTKAKPIRMIEELNGTENLEKSGEQLLGYADVVRRSKCCSIH